MNETKASSLPGISLALLFVLLLAGAAALFFLLLWTAAQQMAQLVERQSPSALRACKTLINQGRSTHRDAALPRERSLFLELFEDANQREGVAAFLEKRAPHWHYDKPRGEAHE